MDWSFQGKFKPERNGDTCEKDWVKDVKYRNARFMGA